MAFVGVTAVFYILLLSYKASKIASVGKPTIGKRLFA